jgi:hypothetical protein
MRFQCEFVFIATELLFSKCHEHARVQNLEPRPYCRRLNTKRNIVNVEAVRVICWDALLQAV